MLLPLLLAFLLLRVIFWFVTFPNPDEAYYWLWGQHPGLSYYDHPPLQAWVQGAFTALLGRSNFVLRLPNLLSNAVFFYTYYRISVYLYGKPAPYYFWVTVLLVLASPLYFLFLALAWHDHLLITFCLISAYQFIRFLDQYIIDGRGDSRRLYGAAIALGLAILCKYNAVFVLAGFVATILADQRLRPLWRDRRLYIAAGIAASALAPIVLWNLLNDVQSFRYYVNRSVNTGGFSFKLSPLINFVLFSFLTVSPVNWVAFIRGFRRSDRTSPSVYPQVAFWVFLISSIALTLIALLSAALYYWNITAYLLLFPLAASMFIPNDVGKESRGLAPIQRSMFKVARRPLFISGQIYGLLFALVLVVHYGFLPLSALGGKTDDPDSRMLFGWEQVQTAINRERNELANPFLVTSDYRSASALAYQLDDSAVMAVSDRIDQFDFWYRRDRPFQTRDAIILFDDWHPMTREFLSQFERTTTPTTVPITLFGVWVKNYYVLRAYGFKGGRVS